jgi:hypothetical protein
MARENPLKTGGGPTFNDGEPDPRLQAHCDVLNALGMTRYNSWFYFVGKRPAENGKILHFVDRKEQFDWSKAFA